MLLPASSGPGGLRGIRALACGRRLLAEVLAEHGDLALVVRPGLVAVKEVGGGCHALVGELADRLAMLDHERDVARAALERRPATVPVVMGVEAEARVEEARVVATELAGRRVV